jgi:hypothetical protein
MFRTFKKITMKKSIIILFSCMLAGVSRGQVCPTSGQRCDPFIQITAPAGSISVNQTLLLNVIVGNNGAPDDPAGGDLNDIKSGTLRVQVSVGCNATIPAQTIPDWTVLSNTGSTIIISNDLDVPGLSTQAIEITAKGVAPFGACSYNTPSTVSANIKYRTGNFDCNCSGTCPGLGPTWSSQGNIDPGFSSDNSSTSITVNPTVLPVVLSAFTVAPAGCDAAISWTTVSELNFDHFDIEYSSDASNYTKVGSVKANNIATGSSYSYRYTQPAGYGYYKLRMVDKDGSSKYSQSVAMYNRCKEPKLMLYPNPVSVGMLSNLVIQNYGSNITGTLTDLSGKVLHSYKFVNGVNKFAIHEMPSTQYILTVKYEKNNTAHLTITVAK